jgi:hypothetical protein
MAQISFRIISGRREYIVKIGGYVGYYQTLAQALQAVSDMLGR